MNLMDSYSDIQFEEIVLSSFSYADCLRKLGYNSNSGTITKKLKEKIEKFQISISHFEERSSVKRTEENVFCKDSTASQKTLRSFYIKKYPMKNCSICGLKPEWNGKPLIFILDHINGSNHDTREENLRWVCPNCNYQLDTTNARNPNYKKYYCKNCGKQISSKEATYCKDCLNILQRTVERPSREELKKLIRSKSFIKIGEQYGVSDNAIRKWCKKENLPFKVSDIQSYSDEQWNEI